MHFLRWNWGVAGCRLLITGASWLIWNDWLRLKLMAIFCVKIQFSCPIAGIVFFQQENSKPHSTCITKQWLQCDWVWAMKRKIRQRKPWIFDWMKSYIQKEWKKKPHIPKTEGLLKEEVMQDGGNYCCKSVSVHQNVQLVKCLWHQTMNYCILCTTPVTEFGITLLVLACYILIKTEHILYVCLVSTNCGLPCLP